MIRLLCSSFDSESIICRNYTDRLIIVCQIATLLIPLSHNTLWKKYRKCFFCYFHTIKLCKLDKRNKIKLKKLCIIHKAYAIIKLHMKWTQFLWESVHGPHVPHVQFLCIWMSEDSKIDHQIGPSSCKQDSSQISSNFTEAHTRKNLRRMSSAVCSLTTFIVREMNDFSNLYSRLKHHPLNTELFKNKSK